MARKPAGQDPGTRQYRLVEDSHTNALLAPGIQSFLRAKCPKIAYGYCGLCEQLLVAVYVVRTFCVTGLHDKTAIDVFDGPSTGSGPLMRQEDKEDKIELAEGLSNGRVPRCVTTASTASNHGLLRLVTS
jgi:hypothetical protein